MYGDRFNDRFNDHFYNVRFCSSSTHLGCAFLTLTVVNYAVAYAMYAFACVIMLPLKATSYGLQVLKSHSREEKETSGSGGIRPLPKKVEAELEFHFKETLGTVRVCRQTFTLGVGIEFHAFALLEFLARVCPMPFLSGVHSSYQFTL
jgi:hypothetical protein